MNARLKEAKRLVVKIGSALLVDNETGNIPDGWLDALASDISWWIGGREGNTNSNPVSDIEV